MIGTAPPPPSWFTPYLPILNVLASTAIAWVTATVVARKNVKKQAFLELLGKLDDLEEAAEALLLTPGNSPEANASFRAVTRLDGRFGRRLTEVFVAHPSKSRLAGVDPVPPRIASALHDFRALACADELASPAKLACAGNDPKFQTLRTCVGRLRNELRNEAESMKAGDLQP